MDFELLNKIKQDILNEPLIEKAYSEDFCGVFVDGTSKLKFENVDFSFHSFRIYSQYAYPIFLFISYSNSEDEICKLIEKYKHLNIILIPPLKTSFEYNYWMFNSCFQLVPSKFSKVYTFQEDGCLIKSGWEDFVTKGDYDMIGAPWKKDIQVLTKKGYLGPLRLCNGGVSYRKREKMIECSNLVQKEGGQLDFFCGICIDGQIRQNNGWLAEDAMFSSIGWGYDIFKPVGLLEAMEFSLEPITFSLYNSKADPLRPFNFHKIDE